MADRLPGWSVDSDADVSFVSNRVAEVEDLGEACLPESFDIVHRPDLGLADVDDIAAEVGQHLQTVAGCLVLS